MKPLNESERAIVNTVSRYGAIDLCSANFLFDFGQQMSVTATTLDRLTNKRWLNRWRLTRRESYFTLSRPACEELGKHWRCATWLGYRPLVRTFGQLWFCARYCEDLLLPAEWAALCPDLHRPGLPAHSYYYNPESHSVGWIQVDLGGPVRNLERRLRKVAQRRQKLFSPLIEANRFTIDVIVSSQGRADTIARADITATRNIPVNIRIITELANYLCLTRYSATSFPRVSS